MLEDGSLEKTARKAEEFVFFAERGQRTQKRKSGSTKMMEMCIMEREGSCGAVSGYERPSTAAKQMSLRWEKVLGKRKGGAESNAVKLGDEKKFARERTPSSG